MKNCLLISDLHLTSNPRDEYRWDVLQQILDLVKDYKIGTVVIAGDLTDAKDNHSGLLVNKIIDFIHRLSQKTLPYPWVYILRGNHDGTNPSWPFFMFLNVIQGVEFIAFPKIYTIAKSTVLMLPHSRNPLQDWFQYLGDETYQECLAHMTVTGAVSENGQLMKGIERKWLKDIGVPIYSGDVHVPQKVRNLTYIGAPYPIKFGDNFKPGCIYFDSLGKECRLPIKSIKRALITVKSRKDLIQLDELSPKDQVKIRIKLNRSSLPEWKGLEKSVKRRCDKFELDCVSVDLRLVEDEDVEEVGIDDYVHDPFAGFCETKQLDPVLVRVGKTCLEQAKGT